MELHCILFYWYSKPLDRISLVISSNRLVILLIIQVHQDDFVLNVKLRLFCLIGKQAAFHQLRTVEQLGYVTSMSRRSVIDYSFLPLLNYNVLILFSQT